MADRPWTVDRGHRRCGRPTPGCPAL